MSNSCPQPRSENDSRMPIGFSALSMTLLLPSSLLGIFSMSRVTVWNQWRNYRSRFNDVGMTRMQGAFTQGELDEPIELIF
jgi:hypothetical protein